MIWAAWILTAIALLLAVGTVAWQTPWIGFFGSLGGYKPGWLIVIALGGVGCGIAAWALAPSASPIIAVALSLLSAFVAIRVIIDQRTALRARGVPVRLGDFFGPLRGRPEGPDEVVTYGPVDGFSPRMGIYLPAPTNAPVPTTLAPVVVHIHGGGWEAGDEASDSGFIRMLTSQGFLVFTPTYTYAAPGAPTWELAPRQIARALAEVKVLAPQYGGSAEQVYLTGSSAGGQLAPLVANRIAAGETLGQDRDALPAIAAVALGIPAVDPGVAEGNPFVPAGSSGRRLVEQYAGGTPAQVPDRYAAISATAHLSAASPPTLLIYGPNDWLVPSTAVLSYAQRARHLGVEVEAVPIPWTGHLMGLHGGACRAQGQLTTEWFVAHPTV